MPSLPDYISPAILSGDWPLIRRSSLLVDRISRKKPYKMSNDGIANKSEVENGGKDVSAGKNTVSGKIFVGGISRETTTEKFTNHFKKYGEIIDSVVMKDRNTGLPRGFGFITYSDASVIDRVIKETHIIDGRTVEIKRSVPRESMVSGPKTKKIFVGGLPTSLTTEDFKIYFEKYGTIVDHAIMQDHASGRSRGFGFVTFDSEDAVDEILSQGKMHEIGGKQVEIKKAEPKKPAEEFDPSVRGPPGKGAYGARGGFVDNYGDGYGGFAPGGFGPGPYRPAGGYGGRGSYGGGFGDESYRGYGAGSYGGYGGPFGGDYGAGIPPYGGAGRGLPGGYGEDDGYGGFGYGGYGSGSFGAGPQSAGGYGSRYGGTGGGRYHPYGRN